MALDVIVLDENGQEVKMTENIDYGDGDLTPLIEGDNNFRYDEDYGEAGYRETTSEEDSFFDAFEEEEEDDPQLNKMDDEDFDL